MVNTTDWSRAASDASAVDQDECHEEMEYQGKAVDLLCYKGC